MKRKAYQIEHSINFTARQWQEICSCSFEPFDISEGKALTRGQRLAVAQMALGKSVMLDDGRYDVCDQDDTGNAQWADELREITDIISPSFNRAMATCEDRPAPQCCRANDKDSEPGNPSACMVALHHPFENCHEARRP